MMAEDIGKPRARASRDGKTLRPELSEKQREKIAAMKNALKERAQRQRDEDKMSGVFFDTISSHIDAAGSIPELRSIEKDLDVRDTLDDSSQRPDDAQDTAGGLAPESLQTNPDDVESDAGSESAPSYPDDFVADMHQNAAHDKWYYGPDGKVVLMDDAAEDEQARQMLEPGTPPAPGFPRFGNAIKRAEAPASGQRESGPAAANAEPPAADDQTNQIEGALRDLASRSPEERNRIRNQQQAGRTPADAHAENRNALNQALHEFAQDHGRAARGGEGGNDAHDNGHGGERPRGHATDALRRGGTGHGGPEHRRNRYAINPRDYVNLKIKHVEDIIHDPVEQRFFGELLNTIAPDLTPEQRRENPDALVGSEVLRKYMQKDPAAAVSVEEMSLIKYAQHEYSKWDKAWSELTAHMTQEDVDMFMRRNENLENIVLSVREGRGQEIFKNVLRHAAMRDQKTFQSIEHAVHEAHAARNSYLGKRSEKKIQDIVKDLGVGRTDFERIIDFSSPDQVKESRRQVEQILRQKAGTGRKIADWIADTTRLPIIGSSRSAAGGVMDRAEVAVKGRVAFLHGNGMTGRMLNNLEGHLQHASHDLDNILDDEVRSLAVAETREHKPHLMPSEIGPQSLAEMRQQNARISDAQLDQTISSHIASDTGWASGDDSYRRASLNRLKRKEEEKLKAGSGLWAWVQRILFGDRFDAAARRRAHQAGAAGATPAAAGAVH